MYNEKELIKQAQNGSEKAVDTLLRRNEREVERIVKRYYFKNLPKEDMKNEARIAIVKAIYSYDCNLNHKLINFAFYKIRSAIDNALNTQSSTIRIPANKIREKEDDLPKTVVFDGCEENETGIDEVAKVEAEQEKELLKKEFWQEAKKILNNFEFYVIVKCFVSLSTMRKIGRDTGVTATWVRDIRNRALQKLNKTKYKEYLTN